MVVQQSADSSTELLAKIVGVRCNQDVGLRVDVFCEINRVPERDRLALRVAGRHMDSCTVDLASGHGIKQVGNLTEVVRVVAPFIGFMPD